MKSSAILFSTFLYMCVNCQTIDQRLAVTRDLINKDFMQFAFLVDGNAVKCATAGNDMKWKIGNEYQNPSSGIVPLSNPTVVHDINKRANVYVQFSDGQIYTSVQDGILNSGCSGYSAFSKISAGDLVFDPKAKVIGKDNVFASLRKNVIYVFARSRSVKSQLHQTIFDGKSYSAWSKCPVGGDETSLLSDASIVLNPYSGAFEAFATFTDGVIYRNWQWSDGSWASWRSIGWGQPSAVSTMRPVAHSMADNFFNGRTEVFAYGKDGLMHHIWQTTCDAVPNVWGYCTWSVWYKIHCKTPKPRSSINSVTTGYNIHRGLELFSVGTDGSLWHSWQLERGGAFHDWESVGRPSTGNILSLPFVTQDEAGWWTAHFITSDYKVSSMSEFRSISVSSNSLRYGGNATVSWVMPVDEACANDWIGIYQHGASNDKYIDFRYVQGEQNPLSTVVPKGHVFFRMFLPMGKYDVRYLVNKEFNSVIHTGLVSTESSKEPHWIQLFRGMVRGLGKETAINVTDCVKNGMDTVQKFDNAFNDFINGQVNVGLKEMGEGLYDLYKAFMSCKDTEIAFKIIGFINDLLACTNVNCGKFVIDIATELYILYKNRYEIYGDIRAAHNAIKYAGAYEQSGMAIGRIVAACISLPTDIDEGVSFYAPIARDSRMRKRYSTFRLQNEVQKL